MFVVYYSDMARVFHAKIQFARYVLAYAHAYMNSASVCGEHVIEYDNCHNLIQLTSFPTLLAD